MQRENEATLISEVYNQNKNLPLVNKDELSGNESVTIIKMANNFEDVIQKQNQIKKIPIIRYMFDTLNHNVLQGI